MKKKYSSKFIMLIVAFSFILSGAGVITKKAAVEWKYQEYDFGKIEMGSKAEAKFIVTNTSMVPLIISQVQPSCGCTVADYPKNPIQPGKSGIIKANYNTATPGYFQKSVFVYANTEQPKTTLIIKGEVVKKQ